MEMMRDAHTISTLKFAALPYSGKESVWGIRRGRRGV